MTQFSSRIMNVFIGSSVQWGRGGGGGGLEYNGTSTFAPNSSMAGMVFKSYS